MKIEIRERDWIYRTGGIDNGSSLPGFAILDTDLRTGISTVVNAHTLVADKAAYERYSGLAANRGNLKARLAWVKRHAYKWLCEYDPERLGIESPFSHLRPQAYAVLCESMNIIDDAAYAYRKSMEFVKVPPGRAKKAVCAPGEYGTDKEHIRLQVLKNKCIVGGEGVNLETLGPDSIDAITVARYLAVIALEEFAYQSK